MGLHIKKIRLFSGEKEALEAIVRKPKTPQCIALRTQIILMTNAGVSVGEIEKKLNTTRATITKWKRRYLQAGMKGLEDSYRPGQPPKYDSDTTRIILREVFRLKKTESKWSIRMLAMKLGLNRGIIQRIIKKYESFIEAA